MTDAPVEPAVEPPVVVPLIILGSPPPWWIGLGGDRTVILSASSSTPGISRNMAQAQTTGGGNLNGSANMANLLGQAGTNGSRIDTPRASAGNYTGVV